VTGTRLALVLLAALVGASVWANVGSSSTPIRRVVQVIVYGQGTVTSVPRGINCPKVCRAYYPKDSLVRLKAQPAAGWRMLHYSGDCKSKTAACKFNLTTNHECSSQVCAVGAFGVHVIFVKQET
jgi:hypothetical protein